MLTLNFFMKFHPQFIGYILNHVLYKYITVPMEFTELEELKAAKDEKY